MYLVCTQLIVTMVENSVLTMQWVLFVLAPQQDLCVNDHLPLEILKRCMCSCLAVHSPSSENWFFHPCACEPEGPGH